MGTRAIKWLAILVFSLITLPFVVVYSSILTPAGGLAIFWICILGIFLFAKWPLEYRGIFLVAFSVGVALLGKAAFGDGGLIEYLYQFVMLVGGGVGGNFIATGLLRSHQAGGKP